MPHPIKIDVLIVAAGNGARAGGDIPKQFVPLAGMPMLRRAIEIYQQHKAIRNIHVVIGKGQERFYQSIFHCHPRDGEAGPGDPRLSNPDALELENIGKRNRGSPGSACGSPEDDKLRVTIGGARRQDSVRLGLEAMAVDTPEFVLIADAARPFTSQKIIDDVVAALSPDKGILTAIPLADTLKHNLHDRLHTLPREHHWLAQTPQAFPFEKILYLHREMQMENFTDDVQLFETAGWPVLIVPGGTRNIKITTAEDFQMAAALLNMSNETRIGHGYDIHRFTTPAPAKAGGDHVWLGGVKIPHMRGVDAHSDGDVVLHALTDALLGTIGAGDIGQHFPPSDPQWKNASSDQFVLHAMKMLRDRGGVVVNADVTILSEAPKVGPHRAAMQSRIAELLGVDTTRVNIKATTTETLGAIGRGEGLAAEVVVLTQMFK